MNTLVQFAGFAGAVILVALALVGVSTLITLLFELIGG